MEQKTVPATKHIHFLLELEPVMDIGVLKNNKARKLDSQLSDWSCLLSGFVIHKRSYRLNKYFKTSRRICAFIQPHISLDQGQDVH